ncbi:MAG: RNA methyltransferase [Actinomycetota bacterium]
MPVEIVDPADGRVDDYRNLTDQRYRRTLEGDEFLIAEGPLSIDRLLATQLPMRSLLCSTAKLGRIDDLLGACAQRSVPCYAAAPAVLESIVGFDLHRGVVAAAARPHPTPVSDLLATARTVALVEGINDPENLGALARAARALFVDGLILDPTCTDPYTRRNVRVSMGEVLHLPIARAATWDNIAARCADAGFEVWALTPAGDAHDLWTLPVPERVALTLGAEGPGLSDQLLQNATHRVRIPIDTDVDSLNVGHAAAIAFAAARHGRRVSGR